MQVAERFANHNSTYDLPSSAKVLAELAKSGADDATVQQAAAAAQAAKAVGASPRAVEQAARVAKVAPDLLPQIHPRHNIGVSTKQMNRAPIKQIDGTRFNLLDLVDSRSGFPTSSGAIREQAICQLVADRSPLASARAGSALPTRQMLRDLGLTGSPEAGGNLAVGHNPLRQLAGAARPLTVLERAGVMPIQIDDANIAAIPRWRGDAGGFMPEGGILPQPAMTLTSVTASALFCGAFVTYNRRLKVSAGADLQSRIIVELERRVREALEDGFIDGDGMAGRPHGLLRQATGAVNLAGDAPTWNEVKLMLETLTDADGDLANSVWLAHPSTAVAAAATERSNGNGYVVNSESNQWTIAGLPLFTSTLIPETVIILLDRRALAPVYFGPPMLITNPYSGSNSILGNTTIVVANYADLAVMEPSLVVVGGG